MSLLPPGIINDLLNNNDLLNKMINNNNDILLIRCSFT